MKEILSDQDTSYIKIFQIRKNKNQKFGLSFDENKTFNCKFIKKISKLDVVSRNTSLAVGDLILCINNEIKFNELSCKELENYLDSYNGLIRILLLSKENVDKLLQNQSDTRKPKIIDLIPKKQTQAKQQEPYEENNAATENIEFEDNEDGSANYNTTTQLITKPTNSQILASIDGLSIKSSFTSDQDSIDFDYLSKTNKMKSIKGLFSIVQPVEKKNSEATNLNNNNNNNQASSSNTSIHSANYEDNFIKIDFSKVFKVTLQKNSNNELGFTVTKLPNGLSCIKEILHEPAILNRSIQTGDIIVSINNSATKSLTHRDVVTYLRISASTVELELFRPDPEVIVPYLNQRKHKQTHYVKSLNSKPNEKEKVFIKMETEASSQDKEHNIINNRERNYGEIEADELDEIKKTIQVETPVEKKVSLLVLSGKIFKKLYNCCFKGHSRTSNGY